VFLKCFIDYFYPADNQRKADITQTSQTWNTLGSCDDSKCSQNPIHQSFLS
jgi:hypothetical protein